MDDVSITLVMWGVEKAADETTLDNIQEIMSMTRRLPVEFQAAYVLRVIKNPAFTRVPKEIFEWGMPSKDVDEGRAEMDVC